MSKLLVQEYLLEIDRLRQWSGSVTEGVISEAFKDLLKAWSRQLGWQFAAQYEFASTQKSRIRPDGTVFHAIELPHGYWEAKDTADDLDTEITKKLARGYFTYRFRMASESDRSNLIDSDFELPSAHSKSSTSSLERTNG